MPEPDARAAAVVLAAGSSTRLGANKLLLPLAGEALVRRAARAALDAALDPVVVVVGHEADAVRGALDGLPCDVVLNAEHARGAGSSLKTGVAAAKANGAAALVVVLADMPFVTQAMLRVLVARWRDTAAPLVVSRYGEAQAPPTLFSRSLFPELLAGDDERCAKRVVHAHRLEAASVSWPAEALRDIDVRGDYDAALSLVSAG